MKNKLRNIRWIIIISCIALTIAMSFSLKNISIEADLKSYFPKKMESMKATEYIEETFGSQDIIMMIFEKKNIINYQSLTRIKKIEKDLNRLSGIRKTNSVISAKHIYGEDGVMYVEPAISRIPRTAEESKEIRKTLAENDLVMNIVLADDFNSTAIIASLQEEANENSIFASIHKILAKYPGDEKIHFGGMPYLRQRINKDIRHDALILVPVALIFMLVFLYLVFREWKGVFLPFLVVIMASVLALGLIPLFGWKFYLISLLVPIMLIAVANDYGIHIIAKYQEINEPGNKMSMMKISLLIIKKLWKPILISGLTTVAGIAALLSHTLVPARQMAVIASIGILMAIFYSIFFIPAVLSLLKKGAPQNLHDTDRHRRRGQLLRRLAFWVVRKYKIIPLYSIVIAGLIGLGIIFLKVDSNEENFFPEKHPVKVASKIINSKYGGSENLSLMFEGDMLDPNLLKRILDYKKELLKEDKIDIIMCFPDIIKEISKALNDPGDSLYNAIPNSREAVAQYLELYNMSGDPESLESLVNFDYTSSHVIIRLSSTDEKDVKLILNKIRSLTKNDHELAAIGGYGFVRSQLAEQVVKGQYSSLIIAILIVVCLLSLIFRSFKGGLIAAIPLSLSIIILFGLMGILGIRLDVATALLSSVMIGVGVDYSIHFLWRYKDERLENRSPREAVITTLITTGRGILFNALSVIVGFIVLVVSSFTPIRFFGVLVVVSITTYLLGAIVLLPAIVLKYDFRIFSSTKSKKEIQEENKLLKAI